MLPIGVVQRDVFVDVGVMCAKVPWSVPVVVVQLAGPRGSVCVCVRVCVCVLLSIINIHNMITYPRSIHPSVITSVKSIITIIIIRRNHLASINIRQTYAAQLPQPMERETTSVARAKAGWQDAMGLRLAQQGICPCHCIRHKVSQSRRTPATLLREGTVTGHVANTMRGS